MYVIMVYKVKEISLDKLNFIMILFSTRIHFKLFIKKYHQLIYLTDKNHSMKIVEQNLQDRIEENPLFSQNKWYFIFHLFIFFHRMPFVACRYYQLHEKHTEKVSWIFAFVIWKWLINMLMCLKDARKDFVFHFD